jgi:hypothetical protein
VSGVEVSAQYGEPGTFRVYVTPPGGTQVDVTLFRDAPTLLPSWGSVDPFGDSVASLTFPAITLMDRPGSGDLSWLVPWADVDIVHFDSRNSPSGWTWEGFMVSEEFGDGGYSVSCKGALFQGDNFLAKPTFPQRPIPYELLIRQAFDPLTNPSLRTSPLVTIWPDDWSTLVPSSTAGTDGQDPLWFLRPWGVTPGQKWTGLTTRSTGSWDPMLTGHVQTLLSVMYTEDGGQWTIRKRTGRVPALLVRPALRSPQVDTLEVYAGVHGITVSLSRDFTQSANVVFGQGQDLAGTSFSGQQVTSDGTTTYYEPFAALPYVYPASTANPRFNQSITRKESMLQFPQGLDEIAAREVAASQVRKFADPGYTGTVTLASDPMQYDRPFSRFLIQAGMSLNVRGLRGTDLLFHITEVAVSMEEGITTLTVDTKFRDALTVQEVRARTRDALDPVKLLQAGKFSVTVQDMIKPWSYTAGSGVIPSGGSQDATEFFTQLVPQNAQFPWTAWTTKYPPKSYPKYYIRLEPANANADLNWSGLLRDGLAAAAIPIKLSQAGSIRLSQIAAYDANGNVLPVTFHIGIYGNSGVNPTSMPTLPAALAPLNGHAAGQHYPLFPGAFDQTKPDGTTQSDMSYLPSAQIDQMVAWGTSTVPAGWVSTGVGTGVATGKLVDETIWSYDMSNQPGFDKYSVENTSKNSTAGMAYVLIYCDTQGAQPVFFMGRLFRSESGAAS